MKRVAVVVAVGVVLVAALVMGRSGAAQNVPPSNARPADQIAILQTEVASLRDQVATLTWHELPPPQDNWRAGYPYNVMDAGSQFRMACEIAPNSNGIDYEMTCVRTP